MVCTKQRKAEVVMLNQEIVKFSGEYETDHCNGVLI